MYQVGIGIHKTDKSASAVWTVTDSEFPGEIIETYHDGQDYSGLTPYQAAQAHVKALEEQRLAWEEAQYDLE